MQFSVLVLLLATNSAALSACFVDRWLEVQQLRRSWLEAENEPLPQLGLSLQVQSWETKTAVLGNNTRETEVVQDTSYLSREG